MTIYESYYMTQTELFVYHFKFKLFRFKELPPDVVVVLVSPPNGSFFAADAPEGCIKMGSSSHPPRLLGPLYA